MTRASRAVWVGLAVAGSLAVAVPWALAQEGGAEPPAAEGAPAEGEAQDPETAPAEGEPAPAEDATTAPMPVPEKVWMEDAPGDAGDRLVIRWSKLDVADDARASYEFEVQLAPAEGGPFQKVAAPNAAAAWATELDAGVYGRGAKRLEGHGVVALPLELYPVDDFAFAILGKNDIAELRERLAALIPLDEGAAAPAAEVSAQALVAAIGQTGAAIKRLEVPERGAEPPATPAAKPEKSAAEKAWAKLQELAKAEAEAEAKGAAAAEAEAEGEQAGGGRPKPANGGSPITTPGGVGEAELPPGQQDPAPGGAGEGAAAGGAAAGGEGAPTPAGEGAAPAGEGAAPAGGDMPAADAAPAEPADPAALAREVLLALEAKVQHVQARLRSDLGAETYAAAEEVFKSQAVKSLAGYTGHVRDSYFGTDRHLADLVLERAWYAKVLVKDAAGRVAAAPEVPSAMPEANWFDFRKDMLLLLMVLIGGFVLYFIAKARKNPDIYLRRIGGLDAVDEALGRATEMGKPVLFVHGLREMKEVSTIAAVNILSEISKHVARFDSKLLCTSYDPVVLGVSQETVREGYTSAGRPDAYTDDDVFLAGADQFSYVAAVNGIMLRQEPAANFYCGYFYAESLILAETGAMSGAIQIAATDSFTQLPFFVTTCDYTLMGEELYAASAYLSRDPLLLGSLKGQDYAKLLVILVLIVFTALVTFDPYTSLDLSWVTDLVKQY